MSIDCGDSPSNCKLALCDASAIDLIVSPKIAGSTTVRWHVGDSLKLGEQALETQIEFSRYPTEAATAWTVVRSYAANTGIWVDTSQRLFGVNSNGYYRITIRNESLNLYRSAIKRAVPEIPKAFKATYNEIIRRWLNRGKRGELRRGVLLKKILSGNRCGVCRDRDSGVQLRSQCLTCFGVGWQYGYYQLPGCVFAEFGAVKVDYEFDENRSYFSNGPVSQVKLLNIPQLYPGDVWVEELTDQRWLLGNMLHAQSIGSTELLTDIETVRLDYTNVVYQFPIQNLSGS